MLRKEFLYLVGGLTGMSGLRDLQKVTGDLAERDRKMPVLFMGHGSPMNGIEENEFSAYWSKFAKEISQPEAVLCISAHWLTRGTHVTAMPNPKTIHDFGGFPKELYDVQYPAPGQPELAKELTSIIKSTDVGLDHDWGLDHGTWTVVRHMYPEANIPVIQLSIDFYKPADYHYKLATELATLRKKGVLIIGSGNMVHNLRRVDWQNMDTPNYGFDWAKEMNETFKEKIGKAEHQALIDYESLGSAAKLAIPTPDHYYPLIYTLGLQDKKDEIEFFNDKYVGGSLTMTSVKIFS
ncbi:4,5-DOPA dioxygenase extradiol [Maribellus comscasis]|uniref:4,5-DOPA dioxygenase extradiol n=1 Tax=Maribellus comscasis TaxID=2681766 RepID=A0A6I6JHA7_9BACT|nr:4,5-DOPA dioxygenase extradiol [Maribellus comscasis]QGY42255.1 4,5-DOPA dioxygenase extradiol [Maribellus comscasis]